MDRLQITKRLEAAATTNKSVGVLNPDAQVYELEQIDILPNADLTANGTNYASMRAYKGTGTGSPITAARTTASTGFTAFTPEDWALSGTGEDLELAADEVYHVDKTHAGSGVAVDLDVVFTFKVRNA